MSAKVLKFSDLDVKKFLEFIKKADVQNIQIIDFTPDKIKCKSDPDDKSFVKYNSIDVEGLLTYDSTPDNFELLLLPLFRFKKLKDTLTIYVNAGIEKVDGEITYEMENENFVGLFLKLKYPKMNVKIKAGEMFLITHMEDKHWEIYCNKEKPLIKFDAKKEFTDRISDLCNLEGDDNVEEKEKNISIILDILKSENTVIFRSKEKDKWDMTYTEDDGNLKISCDKDYHFFIPQKAMQAMKAPLYDLYVVWNDKIDQYVLIMYENEENIMIKGLMEMEPDEQ